MITKIVKRDGRKVTFNVEKIATAIFKAAKEVGGNDFDMAEELAQQVCDYLERKDSGKMPTVEEVQDAVEYVLIENGHATTAKAYILYRAERTRQREMNSDIMQMYDQLTFGRRSYKNKEKVNVIADTPMGTMLNYGAEGAKRFNQIMVLDKKHSKAHTDGDIYIHNLDYLTLTTNSCQIDLIELFKNGFFSGQGHLREPGDISSYVSLACIAIQSNQNDQFGSQSIQNFDYAMANGVKKTYKKLYIKNMIKALELLTDIKEVEEFYDIVTQRIKYQNEIEVDMSNISKYQLAEMEELENKCDTKIIRKAQKFALETTEKEIDRTTYQAMEAFVHNLNTMQSRAGAQVPNSTINYGLDISKEGRLVIKNILLATEAGLGNGETALFPVQVFRVKEGINYNEEDINYDLFKLACQTSMKRNFPNFSFLDAPFNKKYYKKGQYSSEVAYTGSRIRVIENVNDKTREFSTSRGNLSCTSINLPRIAINSNKSIDKFFILLDEKMDLVIEQLLDRYKIQSKRLKKNYPSLMKQGIWLDSDKIEDGDEVLEVLKHGTLAVGFVGLAEALKSLIGYHHGEDKSSQELGVKIVTYMQDKITQERKINKLNFVLYGIASDNMSKRFMELDKKKFGEIPNITDKEEYTNSFHIPKYFNIDAINKIKLEAPYHELTRGGHITYVDCNDNYNIEDVMKILKCMRESGIGYGAINCKLTRDPVCGNIGIFEDECSKCNRKNGEDGIKFERIRRNEDYLISYSK